MLAVKVEPGRIEILGVPKCRMYTIGELEDFTPGLYQV